jgi:SAM-dependent methyltransferase
MSEVAQLDSYTKAYTDDFPYFQESLLTHSAYVDHITRYIRANEVQRVLSLGIGHTEVARCLLAELIEGPVKQYTIVDGSHQIIENFRHSIEPVPPGLELVEGFFETFSISARFDVIEAGFMLEHVDDPAFILNRLHQFIAPQGRVFIAVPNARSLHRVLGHMAGFLEDVYTLSPSDHELGHKHYFDLTTITNLVREAGFKITKTEGLLLKPFTTAQLNKLNLTPAVWQALLDISADYPAISNAIYIEATA